MCPSAAKAASDGSYELPDIRKRADFMPSRKCTAGGLL